jgi:hypothetical protein
MLATVTHFQPLTTIRRERLLPSPGRVLVRKGQKVNVTDVIAEVDINPEHQLLDVARGLGLPAQETDHYIQCKVGDKVSAGDILAGPVGFAKRVIRSPHDAMVVLAGDGQILIKLLSRPYELKAGLPGIVNELINDRGAIITTTGVLIQGVWGNGFIDTGIMIGFMKSQDDVIEPGDFDVSMRGSVVLAGYCAKAEVLRNAAELPLRGLILASIDPKLLPVAEKLPFPLVVIEGFGHLPMNSAAYKLLTTNERREVALNGQNWDRFSGKRPEVIIPIPTVDEIPLPRETAIFEPGQLVRIIRAPYQGKIGKIVTIRTDLSTIMNGLRVQAGEIRLESGDNATLPLANLEVLE